MDLVPGLKTAACATRLGRNFICFLTAVKNTYVPAPDFLPIDTPNGEVLEWWRVKALARIFNKAHLAFTQSHSSASSSAAPPAENYNWLSCLRSLTYAPPSEGDQRFFGGIRFSGVDQEASLGEPVIRITEAALMFDKHDAKSNTYIYAIEQWLMLNQQMINDMYVANVSSDALEDQLQFILTRPFKERIPKLLRYLRTLLTVSASDISIIHGELVHQGYKEEQMVGKLLVLCRDLSLARALLVPDSYAPSNPPPAAS